MRPGIGLICAVLLGAASTISTLQSVAGSCDCRPEVSNASAITVGHCAKLWSNNQCTLKEDGTSSGNVNVYTELQNKVLFHVKINNTPKATLAKGQFDEDELGSAIASLANQHNVDFVASVLNLYHENLPAISKYWGVGTPMLFKSANTTAVLNDKCFYAQDIIDKSNFYVNFDEDNRPCEAWKAVK